MSLCKCRIWTKAKLSLCPMMSITVSQVQYCTVILYKYKFYTKSFSHSHTTCPHLRSPGVHPQLPDTNPDPLDLIRVPNAIILSLACSQSDTTSDRKKPLDYKRPSKYANYARHAPHNFLISDNLCLSSDGHFQVSFWIYSDRFSIVAVSPAAFLVPTNQL
jgi:hypothetical protein